MVIELLNNVKNVMTLVKLVLILQKKVVKLVLLENYKFIDNV